MQATSIVLFREGGLTQHTWVLFLTLGGKGMWQMEDEPKLLGFQLSGDWEEETPSQDSRVLLAAQGLDCGEARADTKVLGFDSHVGLLTSCRSSRLCLRFSISEIKALVSPADPGVPHPQGSGTALLSATPCSAWSPACRKPRHSTCLA